VEEKIMKALPVDFPEIRPGGVARLSPAAVARLLRSGGAQGFKAAHVRADIRAGAPTNDDGTIDFIHYAAWLAAQSAG
jgi:hypothetical protein